MKWIKKYIKKIIYALSLIIILCIIIYNFTFRNKIDTTIQGVEYCIGNSDYIENVTILVKGTYYDSIFKNDRFEGKISVDKYDFTYEKKLLPLYFFNNNYATIRYTYTNTSTDKKDITLGFLRTTSDFNKILI